MERPLDGIFVVELIGKALKALRVNLKDYLYLFFI